jgi:hypothetical protein
MLLNNSLQTGGQHLCLMLLCLTSACAGRVVPATYATDQNQPQVVVPMDEFLHLTPLVPVIDSPQVVYPLLDQALARPGTRVELMVYYTGIGALDYSRASVAGFTLRKLFIEQGYDSTRLQYRAAPSRVPLKEKKYPYRRVDFVVSRLDTATNR